MTKEELEAEKKNSFDLGHAAGYQAGYMRGYLDDKIDRLSEAAGEYKEAIDKLAEEGE